VSDAIEKYTTHIRTKVLEERVRTLQAKLETIEKERDEARDSVEQWRELLWKTLPMEVSRLAFEQARRERDEARLKCEELKKEILQAQGGEGEEPEEGEAR